MSFSSYGPAYHEPMPIDREISDAISLIMGITSPDPTDYTALHAERVGYLNSIAQGNDISVFFRGDNRTPGEIARTGFAARQPATPRQIERLIDLLVMPKYLSSFQRWWKYPSARPGFDLGNLPFVATGLDTPHLGDNGYRIDLPLHFKPTDPARKLLGAGLLYDGPDPDNSALFAIKIDRQEVIFLTPVPRRYISFMGPAGAVPVTSFGSGTV